MSPPDEKILVRSVNWLGDAVMTTPALIRLREARPKSRISILTPDKLADLWKGQPFIDEVLAFSPLQSVWQTSRVLRKGNFGIAITFPNSTRSALELWLSRIPIRAGVGRRLFLNQSVSPSVPVRKLRKRSPAEIRNSVRTGRQAEAFDVSAHHVHHYLNLVRALGASSEPLPPRIEVDAAKTEDFREKFGLGSLDRTWFGLCPGAEYGPAKRWPVERFIETAVALQKETNCRWVIIGNDRERELANHIAAEIGDSSMNLAGRTTLRELAAALKLCKLVLTNDSGPMHLAAAVGTRVVAIFGSTSPELTGPVFSPNARIIRHAVPCAPCFRRECPIDLRCLRGIESQEVEAVCLERLR